MPGCTAYSPGPVPDGMRRAELREGDRWPESRRAQSWRRSDLPAAGPYGRLALRETFLTAGVREWEIGRIYATGQSICLLRDPALSIRTKSRLVSSESADTTDGEQCRCGERISLRSGKRLTSCLHNCIFKRQQTPQALASGL